MDLRWLTPIRPKLFLALLGYFLLSCAIAAFFNGPSERVTSPLAALILALGSSVLALSSFAPVVSPKARQVLLRPDSVFGGNKWGFVLSGIVATAFTGAFVIIAVRGLS